MGAKFVRFYLIYWIVDMVVGVGLCLVGFFTPIVYVRLTLSPLSAAESYGFLIATLAFTAYVWRVRPGRGLYWFPVAFGWFQLINTVVFHVALSRTNPIRITLESAQVEAMQTPMYLTSALLTSLAGVVLWFWLAPDDRGNEVAVVPARLRHLREQRRLASQAKS